MQISSLRLPALFVLIVTPAWAGDGLLTPDTAADTGLDTGIVGGEGEGEAASYSCECFGKFSDGTNACYEHSHSIWLSTCTDFTFPYTSSVPCDKVGTDVVVSNGGYWAAWWGNYSWSNSSVYASQCFDAAIVNRADSANAR